MKPSDKRRSPLQFAPLRMPGQSLTDEMDEVSYDGFLSPLLLALVTIVLAWHEWWRYATNSKPSPWTFTAAAALAIVYAAVRCVRTFRRPRMT
jgi:glucan phosphoethanolaminetransferase (alkaline phosphatase superfamily)